MGSIYAAFVTDNKYVQHLAVTLTSLLEHADKGSHITAYIISDSIKIEDKQKIKRLRETYSFTTNFIDIDSEKYMDLPLRGHFSKAIYFKLALPELIPLDVKKVIYVDCDMIVKDDIDKLWALDLENYYIAAVPDPHLYSRNQDLSIPAGYKYFNAGLMIMNLNLMRIDNIPAKVYEFVDNNKEKLLFGEQDGLNAILYNKWLEIPMKWNVMHYFYDLKKMIETLNAEEYKELKRAIYNPSVIHYTSVPKPWEYMNVHPLKKEYYRYLSKTPWANYKPSDKNIKNMFKKIVLKYPTSRMIIKVFGVPIKKMLPSKILRKIKSFIL